MDFSYSDCQLETQKSIIRFIETSVNPQLDTADGSFLNRELWRVCAAEGLLSFAVPKPWALVEQSDFLTLAIALESVGYACTDNGLPFALAAQGCTVQQTLLHHGSEEQKNAYLPGSICGDLIGAHAMTEADAGSDSARIQMRATRTEGGYRLSGEKIMISMAPLADYAIVFATLNPDAGSWGLTAFLVNRDNPGYSVSEPVVKAGLDRVPMGRIMLDDCFVPEADRLGPEGAGSAIARHSLELERTGILASQVGRMRKQLEDVLAYTQSRQQFGQPIGAFQSVSNRLADMRVRLENAQLLLYKTAWKIDQGESVVLESSMLKLLISEHFLSSSLDCMRIHGGYSYIEDHVAGRDTRDALGGVLYAGTSDIQRNIIAGLLKL